MLSEILIYLMKLSQSAVSNKYAARLKLKKVQALHKENLSVFVLLLI